MRAQRRHHIQRLKHNRRYYWGRDLSSEPTALGKCVNNPAICSCPMCGSRRRFEGKSIQERRHD